MRSRRALVDAFLVGLTRALVSAACLWSGFRAISDDDYARVAIAARFATAPSLDPSGTSWLPLPFWLYGVPMALFGDSLATARCVAFGLGIASALLLWLSGRCLGLGERAALLGALAAVLLPYGSWLSVATVPEAPCAALLVFGVVSLARDESKLRLWGALAMAAACFCRYEAWAPTLVFALLSGAQALRRQKRELGLAALLALSPIGLWLLHGLVRHGDALFFVARVTQYRAALGQPSAGWLQATWDTLGAIVHFEPELFAVTGVALLSSIGKQRFPLQRAALGPLGALAALVLLLIAAAASGGSATHHPERSLLPLFWFMALLAAGLLPRLAQAPGRARWLPLLALPLALAGNLLLRPELRHGFADRGEEEQLGKLLRRLDARDVALDTDDFGYFAVQAALGYARSFPLDEHDPRLARAPRPASSGELAERLLQRGAKWLVTPRARAALASGLGQTRAATPRLSLIELDPNLLGQPR